MMEHCKQNEVNDLYQHLIKAWNSRHARDMADLFTENGESIGFDGSQSFGREEIFLHLEPIFSQHPTPLIYNESQGYPLYES